MVLQGAIWHFFNIANVLHARSYIFSLCQMQQYVAKYTPLLHLHCFKIICQKVFGVNDQSCSSDFTWG
jgi:hypothetical protein